MILPPSASKIELTKHQGFLMAQPIGTPSPEFPAGLLLPDGKVDVCIEFVVTAEGATEGVRLVSDIDGCTPSPPPALVRAATNAVLAWEFIAAARCEFPEGVEKTEDCSGDHVLIEAIPIRLMYGFTFEIYRGKRRVIAELSGQQ